MQSASTAVLFVDSENGVCREESTLSKLAKKNAKTHLFDEHAGSTLEARKSHGGLVLVMLIYEMQSLLQVKAT